MRLHIAAIFLALSVASQGAEHIPWTTSRVHGSPEPPAPYCVERAFPKLTFAAPLEAAAIPGTDRMVVIEQRGRLFTIPGNEDCERADLFANLKEFEPEVVECYSIAFHPQFAQNRFVFVWINLDLHRQRTRENGTRIVRFRVTDENPPRLDIKSAETVFTWLSGGHNGGNLRFGPDGMLYIATGDAGTPDPPDPLATGQDISDVLASVLRIDVDHPDAGRPYGIPPGNPFVATPGARGEVWAYGFRNPWRMSFDPKTGALWLGDVGWELWEMVYRVERGGNYGWSITEGGRQDVRPDRPRGPTPILPPVAVHPHREAASITGGEVYRGKRLPELHGAYLYGDWQMGAFWALDTTKADATPRELCRSTLMPAGFGVAPEGELLICDHGGGGLWRLARNPDAGKPSPFPRRLSETGLFSDTSRQTPAAGVIPFSVAAPRWADSATGERWIALPGDGAVAVADKELGVMPKGRWVFPAGTVLAKTYSLQTDRSNAACVRRIETQLLHFDGRQWAAYAYRWNDAQTDAELAPAEGAESVIDVKDDRAPGGGVRQTWRTFARTECLRCHNLPGNFAAGFSPPQLPPAAAHLFGLPDVGPRLADPYSRSTDSLELRARSYLHANCATCHRFSGGGSVPSLMNIELDLRDAKLVSAKPVQGDLGLPEGRVIAPGDPARSVLLYRVTTSGRGHMPYLGANGIDARGVLLLRDWIAGMEPEHNLPDEVRQRREAERRQLAQLRAGDAAPLDALLSTSSGALSVALALYDGSLSGALRRQAVAKGSALADPMRRGLFEPFLPAAHRRQTLGPNIAPDTVLTLTGDASRGKSVFGALCAACHRVGDVGVDFGPDLTQIGAKHPRPTLLEQILQPSKIVEPQWRVASLTLRNGEALGGFITARNDKELTMRLPGGGTQKVALADVVRTDFSPVSAMPEALLAGLTAQEAADLLAFLSALK